jgi:hypothetical protein
MHDNEKTEGFMYYVSILDALKYYVRCATRKRYFFFSTQQPFLHYTLCTHFSLKKIEFLYL